MSQKDWWDEFPGETPISGAICILLIVGIWGLGAWGAYALAWKRSIPYRSHYSVADYKQTTTIDGATYRLDPATIPAQGNWAGESILAVIGAWIWIGINAVIGTAHGVSGLHAGFRKLKKWLKRDDRPPANPIDNLQAVLMVRQWAKYAILAVVITAAADLLLARNLVNAVVALAVLLALVRLLRVVGPKEGEI